MTNEEKARELSEKLYSGCKDYIGKRDLFSYLVSMAKWKDEQFSKFLSWLDDHYVIRRFTDGEPMTYEELIDAFKNMEQQ